MAYSLQAVDNSLSTFNFNIARMEADVLEDFDGKDFTAFVEVRLVLCCWTCVAADDWGQWVAGEATETVHPNARCVRLGLKFQTARLGSWGRTRHVTL